VSGCAGDAAFRKQRAQALRDNGEAFLQAGQTNRALEQFLKALEDDPKDPYLHYDLAWAYNLKGVNAKAEFHAKEAIRLKPDFSVAQNYLGTLYFRSGRVDLAIESYQKALSNVLYTHPQDAHFNLGSAYLSRKEYDKAVEHLEKATRLVPEFVAAYNNLGEAYEGLHKNDKARRSYEKALELAPDYVMAHLNLGKLLYRSGERQAAARSFDQVIQLDPDSDAALEAQRYLNMLK